MTAGGGAGPVLSGGAWVKTTTIGWFLGFLVMIGLIFLGELVPGVSESSIGIAIGAGVGYWQSRFLRGALERTWRWAVASGLGMGAPFVLSDVSAVVSGESWLSLPACVAIGGVAVAVWQWRLLAPIGRGAVRWIIPCALGWFLPAIAILVSDSGWVAEPWDGLFSLAGIFFGGAMLGALTAGPLVRILTPEPEAA